LASALTRWLAAARAERVAAVVRRRAAARRRVAVPRLPAALREALAAAVVPLLVRLVVAARRLAWLRLAWPRFAAALRWVRETGVVDSAMDRCASYGPLGLSGPLKGNKLTSKLPRN
jgi:hypothetical protein